MRLAVIGAGKWGVALHNALRQVDKDAAITSRKPKNLVNFTDVQSAVGAEMIVMALSTQSTESWLKEHFRFNDQAVLVCSKGIETSGGRFLNEIYEQFVPKSNLAFLSGPGFAAEVIQNLPTALTIAAEDERIAARFMGCFPKWIKTYRINDVIGVEVAGAYKNVIAIAAGVCDALSLGSNARAALITRGLAEMTRFGIKFGAKLETFLGLSGVGDLALTATSALSRNYRVGQALGNNEPLNATLERLGEVAEGVPTARAIVMLSEKNKLYTPIAKEVVAVLDGKEPLKSLQTLLERTNEKEF